MGASSASGGAAAGEREIRIAPAGLPGDLALPAEARGLVVFAHGSGSSRKSPRNRLVAEGLREAGLATLLFDLLTPEEARDRRNVFDVPLLAARLREAARFAAERSEARGLPQGYFGASTGAAAALVAAAEGEPAPRAVVSRGGRPDLAGEALPRVRAPTLLLVGERDPEVLELNRRALRALGGEKELVVVPGATHLFEEPGTLEVVVEHARRWLARHVASAEGAAEGG